MTNATDPMVAKARSALDSFSVKLRNFIMLVRDADVVACVFEGEDHLYFGSRIDSHIPSGKKRVNFPMHGKNNVLRLYSLRTTNPDVRNARALYFVDKDFDSERLCDQDRLYMTPCYSIENFYVSNDAIGRIIRDCFKVEEYRYLGGDIIANEEYVKVKGHITGLMQRLEKDYILPFNAYILAGKQATTSPTVTKNNEFTYKDFTFTEYLEISQQKIKVKKEFNFINITASLKAFGLFPETEFSSKISQLNSESSLIDFRGKNNFELLCLILQTIFEDAGKTVPKLFSRKREASVSFDIKTSLADLSSFADTPKCLQEFLRTELSMM